MRVQDQKMIYNVFREMCNHDENPQCYRVENVEDVIEVMFPRESPLLYIEFVIVNFIDRVE